MFCELWKKQNLFFIFCLFLFQVAFIDLFFQTFIMYWIQASCIDLMYEILFICFFIYFVVYSNHFNCIAAHGVGVHNWAREQPVQAGTQRRIISGVSSCQGTVQNSRNMYTCTYGDKCAWEWKRGKKKQKRKEVRTQMDARVRLNHKNENAAESGG